METLKKHDVAYSRQTKNKGRIKTIEWDEFYHTLMYQVEFESYLNPNMIEDLKHLRKFPGYYLCWFKSNDLSNTPVNVEPTNEN